jgi:hypothetical protein
METIGVTKLNFMPLLYAVALSLQVTSLAIFPSGLCVMVSSCVLICDPSLPPRDRATGKALCAGTAPCPQYSPPLIEEGFINQIFIEEGLTKVEPDGMSEEEKVDEVVSRLKRLLDKQKNIEDRMKKIEEAMEKKEPQE